MSHVAERVSIIQNCQAYRDAFHAYDIGRIELDALLEVVLVLSDRLANNQVVTCNMQNSLDEEFRSADDILRFHGFIA